MPPLTSTSETTSVSGPFTLPQLPAMAAGADSDGVALVPGLCAVLGELAAGVVMVMFGVLLAEPMVVELPPDPGIKFRASVMVSATVAVTATLTVRTPGFRG